VISSLLNAPQVFLELLRLHATIHTQTLHAPR
jgi:hypothetical protein